ncbi:MAG: phosphate acetyltransferase [Lachnospiraceae bacterium]|nr:phosphate acetyltransferase [Lachnospiraceae bacterium]
MSLVENAKIKAKNSIKTIVFPEGDEKRTVQAAAILQKEGLVKPVLLGNKENIEKAAHDNGADISGIMIIDPELSPDTKKYAEEIYELRKAKGVTEEQALSLARDVMYYGIMMVKDGDADGLVSGAVHTTGDMLRPALQLIKTKPGIKVVSSSFLMEMPNKELGHDGLLVYSDCVVMPNPTAEELACIAVSAADTAKTLCGIEEPKVALLSFSTKGSAKHELVTKVQEAVKLAHEMAPGLCLDGEMQFDAALIPAIGESKAPGSPVAGHANVFVFPDLQAGNIGYKITERLGGAKAVAVLQGLAKPCNDLSRGCSVDDIVTTAVLTALQAQGA